MSTLSSPRQSPLKATQSFFSNITNLEAIQESKEPGTSQPSCQQTPPNNEQILSPDDAPSSSQTHSTSQPIYAEVSNNSNISLTVYALIETIVSSPSGFGIFDLLSPVAII